MSAGETPPVLFLVYKRPEVTQTVFNAIRAARPAKLFVGADGPKENRPDDIPKIAAVRRIVQNVDWPCEVKHLFQERNVGSKVAESTAISFFFDQVEEGIILEDDCLPDASFFPYCAELLARYRHDTRVMHIGGNNFQFGRKIGDGSYYFSQFPSCWGWASWRRAWKLHDPNMSNYPEFKEQRQIANIIFDGHIRRQFSGYFDTCYFKKADAWDYPWAYTILSNRGLCILPNTNLVTNIGFGADSTSCVDANSAVAGVPTGRLSELIHPRFMLYSVEADKAVFYRFHPPWYLHAVAEFVRVTFPRRVYEWCMRAYLVMYRRLHRATLHAE